MDRKRQLAEGSRSSVREKAHDHWTAGQFRLARRVSFKCL